MMAVRAVNSEPIPGYRLLEPLGRGGFGEVWKCEAPGGLLKAIKFVSGSASFVLGGNDDDALRELKALQHVKSIRHPFLLAMDRVEQLDDDLLIVMELADRSLHDLLVEYRRAGQPGISRRELLGYLREAAEVLDLMNQEYGLQHLDVKPRNLFLVGRHVKVADFGLVNSLADLARQVRDGEGPGAASPLYAAPEIFSGQVTLFSDQYSLAVTYQELLTGTLPFSGTTFQQLAVQHLRDEPDLGPVPESDRPALARALAKEPRQRFPSCTAFVAALEAVTARGAPGRGKPVTRTDFPRVEMAATATISDSSRIDLPRADDQDAAPAKALPASDPLAGYRFLECLVRAPTGEVWKVQGPSGPPRLLRFLAGVDPAAAEGGLARWQKVRHPALLSAEVVRGGPARLALLHDLTDGNLGEWLKRCRQQGMPGIPRDELLGALGGVAAALDELYREHQLQHLGLSPRVVVLEGRRARLMDFALAELFWMPAGVNVAELNSRYAAPELLECRPGPRCDQYSLALLFAELLVGMHPFRNLNPRQLASARLRGQPDLGLLPGPDRAVLLRALSPDPERRFASNLELLEALGERATADTSISASRLLSPPRELRPAAPPRPRQPLRQVLAPLLEAASREVTVHEKRGLRYLEFPGPLLEYRCCARLAPGTAPLKLESFREQWQARMVSVEAGRATFEVSASANLWQRCLGLTPALEVRVGLSAPTAGALLTEVAVGVRPAGRGSRRGELLNEVAPAVLESLHHCLHALPERRCEARLPLELDVEVCPLAEDGSPGAPVYGRVRDVSWRGMGLSLPNRPHGKYLLIRVPQTATPAVPLPGRIVHGKPDAQGRYRVGVSFAAEEG